MILQLSTGKIINISIEEYLSLSDQDLQDLSMSNLGSYPKSPWEGSTLKISKNIKNKKDIDTSIDYNEENEDIPISISSCITNVSFITIDDIHLSLENEDEDLEESKDI